MHSLRVGGPLCLHESWTTQREEKTLQAKIQKHEAFEAEVQAHSKTITTLDKTGNDMIQHGHYASDVIQVETEHEQIHLRYSIQKRLEELHRLWDQLLFKLRDKGKKLQQALKLLQFVRQCDEVLYWIRDKVGDCLSRHHSHSCSSRSLSFPSRTWGWISSTLRFFRGSSMISSR